MNQPSLLQLLFHWKKIFLPKTKCKCPPAASVGYVVEWLFCEFSIQPSDLSIFIRLMQPKSAEQWLDACSSQINLTLLGCVGVFNFLNCRNVQNEHLYRPCLSWQRHSFFFFFQTNIINLHLQSLIWNWKRNIKVSFLPLSKVTNLNCKRQERRKSYELSGPRNKIMLSQNEFKKSANCSDWGQTLEFSAANVIVVLKEESLELYLFNSG